MGDLVFKSRGEPVNIVGINKLDEGETNYLGVTDNQDAQTTDVCDTTGVYGTLSVGQSAVEVKVGALPLAVRKAIHIQAKGQGVYWGYDNSVTTSNGTELFRNSTTILPIGPNISVYLIAVAGTVDVRIGELA